MAKKKKVEGIIKNSEKELPVDFVAVKESGEETKKEEGWNIKTVETESKTKLEDDKGTGDPRILRAFTFSPNPETFKEKLPHAQEIFNCHIKQIEIELWKDGWVIEPEIVPRLLMAKNKSHYVITVGAKPAKGNILSFREQPKTLTEIIYDTSKNSN